MGFLKRSATVVGIALVAGGASILRAQTFFQGTATGCFFPVAGSCTGSSGSSWNGLSYADGGFQGTTAAPQNNLNIGGTSSRNLGQFSVTGDAFNYVNVPFLLNVSFLSPTGVTPDAIYNASLYGSVVANDWGGVTIDFDNTAHLFNWSDGTGTYGFTFSVNDIDVTAGESAYLTGKITTTPEPGTLILLGSGLVGLVPAYRRRKQSA